MLLRYLELTTILVDSKTLLSNSNYHFLQMLSSRSNIALFPLSQLKRQKVGSITT